VKNIIFLIIAVSIAASSCQSVQKDLFVSGMDDSARAAIADLEETIVRLEASPQANAIEETRKTFNALEKDTLPDSTYRAFLSAWSGRLYLLRGQTNEARLELKKSLTLSPGNWAAAILSSRLERDGQKRLSIIENGLADTGYSVQGAESEGAGELHLEKGRILLELGRYAEAVAAFDLAFTLLEDKPYYREVYRPGRDRAWEMRDIAAGNKTGEIVANNSLTWLTLIEITKTETDLLRFLTAGRDFKPEEIYTRLLERSFIPQTQNVKLNEWPAAKPGAQEEVTRSGAAWFIWRLYAENRANRALLSRYSSRYTGRPGAQSPVPDIPLLSPFFDSVLGCVEAEFMSLPDGKNFFPEEKVRPSAYLSMLKKINL
jgi:tetratricopeptide (TPR) repeat protein